MLMNPIPDTNLADGSSSLVLTWTDPSLCELFSDIMPTSQDRVPNWTLDEIGYTLDAPQAQLDAKDGLSSPKYYWLNSPSDSWAKGLQAIDDFDWGQGVVTVTYEGVSAHEKIQSSKHLDATELVDHAHRSGLKQNMSGISASQLSI